MTIFTIGYEGMDMVSFQSLLAAHGVDTVIDVREMPISRKPGFSKRALEQALTGSGMRYIHMASLGCPKPIRDQYRMDGSWSRYTRGFSAYLTTQQDAIAHLATLALESRCALLCYEADFNYCHRAMVADAVRNYCQIRVQHLCKPVVSRTMRVVPGSPVFA